MLFYQTLDVAPEKQPYLDEDRPNRVKHPCKCILPFICGSKVYKDNIFMKDPQTTGKLISCCINNLMRLEAFYTIERWYAIMLGTH